MHEQSIAAMLQGARRAADLNREALDSIERVDALRERIHITPREEPFEVTAGMLIRICDAGARAELVPAAIRAVAFAIITSPAFEWSDDLVGEILHDWSAPEVNYPLTVENLLRFRRWLTHEEPYPQKSAAKTDAASGSLVSETTRVETRA